MTTYTSYVLSAWIGTGVSGDPLRPKITHDLENHVWKSEPSWSSTDNTGTPSSNLPNDPNGVILLFTQVNDVVKDFIDGLPDVLVFDWEAEPDMEILPSQEVIDA